MKGLFEFTLFFPGAGVYDPLLWAITCRVSGLRDFIFAYATLSCQIKGLLPDGG